MYVYHEKSILFLGVKKVGALALEKLISANVPICTVVSEYGKENKKITCQSFA